MRDLIVLIGTFEGATWSSEGVMLRGSSVFTGRQDEMRLLDGALRADGLVLLTGEAGLGKSRLLLEFLKSRQLAVAVGRPEVLSYQSYSLIISLLESLAESAESIHSEARELAQSLESADLGSQPPARRIAASVRGLVSSSKLVGVAFEDLHWADELSLAVVAHLARSAKDDRLRLLGTARPADHGADAYSKFLEVMHRDRLVHQIELRPLSEEESFALISESGWLEALGKNAADTIVTRSEGIPFFIEELAAGSSPEGVPQTVALATRNRLNSIDAVDRSVLQAAALVSGQIDAETLAAALSRDLKSVTAALLAGIRAGLLREGPDGLAFRHLLVSDAVVALTGEMQRKQMHGYLAKALVERGADGTGAKRIADHFFEAGEYESAAKFYSRAVKEYLRRGALNEAIALSEFVLQEVRAGVQDPEIVGSLGEAKGRLGEHVRAVELLEAASGMVEDKHKVRYLLQAASFASRFDLSRSQDLVNRAVECARASKDQGTMALALAKKGDFFARVIGDVSVQGEAVACLDEALRIAESLSIQSTLIESLDTLSWLQVMRGDLNRAREPGERACQLALTSSSDELIARTHSNAAVRLVMSGEGDAALRSLEFARSRLGKWESFFAQACDHMRLWALWHLGRPEAAEHLAIVLDPSPFGRGWVRVCRAWAAMERGSDWIAEAIISDWWREVGGPSRRRELTSGVALPTVEEDIFQLVLCELVASSLEPGRIDDERIRLARGFLEASRGGASHNQILAFILLMRLLIHRGRASDALAHLADVTSESIVLQSPLWRGLVLEVHGGALLQLRRPGDAVEPLTESVRLLIGAQNQSDAARVQRMLGETLIQMGDRDRGLSEVLSALSAARASGAILEMRACEGALRSEGVRPRAGRPRGSGLKRGELSTREREVAVLVAAGATNAEIATKLFLSRKTVENHISRAQKRLGVTGRAGLAAWAARNGLV